MAISAEKHQLMAKALNNQRKMKMMANQHQWRNIGSVAWRQWRRKA
jgi:hypothetical protein